MAVVTGCIPVHQGKLYYEMAGNGPSLILIHAPGVDSRMWDEQFFFFARHYRVVRYDWRGLGRSETAPGRYAYHHDLYQLCQFLRLRQLHLVGLSAGAGLALDFTVQYPAMVKGLVLASISAKKYLARERKLDPAVTQNTQLLLAAIQAQDMERTIELLTRLRIDGPQREPDEVSPQLRTRFQTLLYENLARQEQSQASPLLLHPPAFTRLNSVHTPTLILYGEYDGPDIVETAAVLKAHIDTSQAIEIRSAAHMLNMEQPDRFNTLVHHFLSAQTGQ